MKKLLYGTTALVGTSLIAASAAQAQEQGIQIGLSGFMNAYQGFADVDEGDGTDQNAFPFYHDSTINFIGSTTLDNGVEAGVRFELESFGHPGDEQWLWLRGSFGSFEMGWVNSAGYRMSEHGPDGSAGVPINTGWITAFVAAPATQVVNFRSVATGTYLDTHNDDYSVEYFSPRFAGFQIGASFTPYLAGKGSNNSTTQSFIGSFNANDENTQWHNAYSVGLNYSNSFDGIDVGLSAGYNEAQSPDNGAFGDDQEQYLLGGNISVAGFTFGGSWAHEDSNITTSGTAWEAGVAYSAGPSTFSISYVHAEYEGALPTGACGTGGAFTGCGEQEHEAATLNYGYALGPGITLGATLMFADYDGDIGNVQDQDGWALILGTTFVF